jgi:hypothetical protein
MRDLETTEVPQPTCDYKPSNIEALREHEIYIRFLSRGCTIRVGCKEIPFENVKEAMVALNQYVESPYLKQQEWRKILE